MKTIFKIMPALFALFLLTAPLLLSSHGQVPNGRTRDRLSTAAQEQTDSTRTDLSHIKNTNPTNDATKAADSKEPSVKIGSRSDDPKFKSLGCGLFCRRCEEAGGSCVPTSHGCYCM